MHYFASASRTSQQIAAQSTDVGDHVDDLCGLSLGVPAQVQHLPPDDRRTKVAVLVGRLHDRAEMELPAVSLESETDRRNGEIESGDELAGGVGEDIWALQGRNMGVIEQPMQLLLEPGVGQCAFSAPSAKCCQQHTGARLTGSVNSNGSLLQPERNYDLTGDARGDARRPRHRDLGR